MNVILINYPVKVYQTWVTAIFNLISDREVGNMKKIVSNCNNKFKITYMKWLNYFKIRKFYESIVIYLIDKEDVDKLIFKKLIKIREEIAYVKLFEE